MGAEPGGFVRMQVRVGEADRALTEGLDEEIYAFNAEATGLYDGRLLTVRASNGESLVGGLSGWTWGGCGYVDVLWIAADYRGRGLGTEVGRGRTGDDGTGLRPRRAGVALVPSAGLLPASWVLPDRRDCRLPRRSLRGLLQQTPPGGRRRDKQAQP